MNCQSEHYSCELVGGNVEVCLLFLNHLLNRRYFYEDTRINKLVIDTYTYDNGFSRETQKKGGGGESDWSKFTRLMIGKQEGRGVVSFRSLVDLNNRQAALQKSESIIY